MNCLESLHVYYHETCNCLVYAFFGKKFQITWRNALHVMFSDEKKYTEKEFIQVFIEGISPLNSLKEWT